MRGGGQKSIFDDISKDDTILAFFPCTMFQEKNTMLFKGVNYQQTKWTQEQKLEYSIDRHDTLNLFYKLISKLVLVCLRKNIKLVIENPYSQQSYLNRYWCVEPTLIDKDRTINGDYYKKPTQYFFINFKPQGNFLFEPIEFVEKKTIENISDRTQRSMIHPQYARRFIKEHLVGAIS